MPLCSCDSFLYTSDFISNQSIRQQTANENTPVTVVSPKQQLPSLVLNTTQLHHDYLFLPLSPACNLPPPLRVLVLLPIHLPTYLIPPTNKQQDTLFTPNYHTLLLTSCSSLVLVCARTNFCIDNNKARGIFHHGYCCRDD